MKTSPIVESFLRLIENEPAILPDEQSGTDVAIGFSDHCVVYTLSSTQLQHLKRYLAGFAPIKDNEESNTRETAISEWLSANCIRADRYSDYDEAAEGADYAVDLISARSIATFAGV
jgi:hypothetical protein